MDAILSPLINAGIPGAMAAAFIYFCWHVVTKTIPEQRKEFLAELKSQRDECAAERAAERAEAKAERAEARASHEATSERQSRALDALSAELRALGGKIDGHGWPALRGQPRPNPPDDSKPWEGDR